MAANGNGKDPVFVVVQLTGGNDFMNTLIPIHQPGVSRQQAAGRDSPGAGDSAGRHAGLPSADWGPVKDLYDKGMVGIVQGIGYPNSSRSHFRGMDIWHTCEPFEVSTIELAWAARSMRELDPERREPADRRELRHRAAAGDGDARRAGNQRVEPGQLRPDDGHRDRERAQTQALEIFKQMYGQAIGTGPVMEYLSRTGQDVLSGRGHAQGRPGAVRVQRRVRGQPDREERCATWRASTPPTWELGSSTHSTAATTRTPTRCPRIPS